MIPQKEGDKRYTQFFGLNKSQLSSGREKHIRNVYRIFQTSRLSKSQIIRELKVLIQTLEKEQEETRKLNEQIKLNEQVNKNGRGI